MKKPETKLAEACIAWVKKQGGDAWHVHGSALQRAGEPDIDGAIVWDDGSISHFKIELKVGDNQPSKLQEARLTKWRSLGYITGVVWSLEEFQMLVLGGQRLKEKS
jgi:hypothetical protein